MSILSKFAADPADSDAVRLEKVAAIIISGSCSLAGIVWAIMYYAILGLGFTAFLPLAFTIIVGIAILVSHFTKNHYWAVYAQIICIMYVTALIQWRMGGILDSGFVMAWAFCGPVTALTFFSVRQSMIWFFLYLVNIFITVYFNDYFTAGAVHISDGTKLVFLAMNIGVSSLVVFIFASFFVSNMSKERARANELLLNIFPTTVANELKQKGESDAMLFDEVTVIFTDFVGFTTVSEMLTPKQLVDELHTCFTAFDSITAKHKIEKIKTVGDSYLAVCGLPHADEQHAENVVSAAIEIRDFMLARKRELGDIGFDIRIGIHSGNVVAGIVGVKKFAYDIWGDTVNTAARMEQKSEAGKINISQTTYELVRDKYNCAYRGEIEAKNKGMMKMYFVEG